MPPNGCPSGFGSFISLVVKTKKTFTRAVEPLIGCEADGFDVDEAVMTSGMEWPALTQGCILPGIPSRFHKSIMT